MGNHLDCGLVPRDSFFGVDATTCSAAPSQIAGTIARAELEARNNFCPLAGGDVKQAKGQRQRRPTAAAAATSSSSSSMMTTQS